MDIDIDTSYLMSLYHGNKEKPAAETLTTCETCYQAKEQEYLTNYEYIFKEAKAGGQTIKNGNIDC